MAALVLPFRHKLDDGNFGIGPPRTIDSGSIWGKRTCALGTRNLAYVFRLHCGAQPNSDLPRSSRSKPPSVA